MSIALCDKYGLASNSHGNKYAIIVYYICVCYKIQWMNYISNIHCENINIIIHMYCTTSKLCIYVQAKYFLFFTGASHAKTTIL